MLNRHPLPAELAVALEHYGGAGRWPGWVLAIARRGAFPRLPYATPREWVARVDRIMWDLEGVLREAELAAARRAALTAR